MGILCSTPKPDYKASVVFSQEYKGVVFQAVNGDITEAEVDAIINGSNPQLNHNNGLANSLVDKGGQTIQEESNKIRQENKDDLAVGSAVITSGGRLKAKFIIHVISPIWSGGSNGEEEKLGECVTNSLLKAEELKVKSIAVPSLDGGVLGFPKENAAQTIVQKCLAFLDKNPKVSISNIQFVNNDAVTVNAFKAILQKTLGEASQQMNGSVHLAREEVPIIETPVLAEKKVEVAAPVHVEPVVVVETKVETVVEPVVVHTPVEVAAPVHVAEVIHAEPVVEHKPVEIAAPVHVEPVVEAVKVEEVAFSEIPVVPAFEAVIEQAAPVHVEPVVEVKVEEVVAPVHVEPVVEVKVEEVVAPVHVEPVVEVVPVVEAKVEEVAPVHVEPVVEAAKVEEVAFSEIPVVPAFETVLEEVAPAHVEPVVEVKVEEPVAEVKVEEPVAEVKVEEPVAEVKVEEPVAEVKVEEPVAEVKAEEKTTEEIEVDVQKAIAEAKEAASETTTEATETTETTETKEEEAKEAEAEEGAPEEGGKKKKNKKKGKKN